MNLKFKHIKALTYIVYDIANNVVSLAFRPTTSHNGIGNAIVEVGVMTVAGFNTTINHVKHIIKEQYHG
ncbi:hypothetical protein D9V86_09905 [Bacteroidetes/Chlorobi group bacterium ChocPot_Mid]|nr:MAG: hypothetical protein D9V86_09905 [Bacteroidetes/Chlorobi group bacterium ChocPot_Mid]